MESKVTKLTAKLRERAKKEQSRNVHVYEQDAVCIT